MHILAISLISVASDVGIGFIGLVIGCLATAAYYSLQTPKQSVEDPPNDPAQAASANVAARTNMAASQLRDLAQNVASDVGRHSNVVAGISAELGAIDRQSCNHGEQVQGAVAKLLAANELLQTRLEEAEQRIQSQADELNAQHAEARTDALTGLANRRAFDAIVQEQIERFEKHHRPFTLLILDIDHFKRFNDQYGHLAGDEVLRIVGQTLPKVIKSTDVACRYGGEEFAVILPDCRVSDARLTAERVRSAIEGMSVTFDEQTLRVTASAGVAEVRSGDAISEVVRRADDGVYASKRLGRNCGHWHNGERCLPIQASGRQLSSAGNTSDRGLRLEPGPGASADQFFGERAFAEVLDRRIDESRRTGTPISVLYFGIAGYNDIVSSYGEAVGSLMLGAIGDSIKATLRSMDVVGKTEGGAFVAILPGSSESAALIIGQRVRANIASCAMNLGHSSVHCEVQLGVAAVETAEDARQVLVRAKRARVTPLVEGTIVAPAMSH